MPPKQAGVGADSKVRREAAPKKRQTRAIA